MKQVRKKGNPLVLSYLELRTVVGIIGIGLPFALSIGGFFTGERFPQASLSIYYHTACRNVFVASLSVIGAFLGACKGYDLRDEIAGYIAGLSAIGVAFFPTDCLNAPYTRVGILHYGFASVLFATLSYFCIVLFRETADPATRTRQKLQRNAVYLVCGIIMLTSILLLALLAFVPFISKLVPVFSRVFWLESAAILAFGVAWLTKGEAILGDKPEEDMRQEMDAPGDHP